MSIETDFTPEQIKEKLKQILEAKFPDKPWDDLDVTSYFMTENDGYRDIQIEVKDRSGSGKNFNACVPEPMLKEFAETGGVIA